MAAGALKLSRRYGGQPVLLVTGNIRHLPEAAFRDTLVRPVRPGAVLKDLLVGQPAVADVLNTSEKAALQDAENRFMRKITVTPRKEYHLEQFDLVGK